MNSEARAAMRRSRSVLLVVVLALAGALVVPGGVSAVPARRKCRPTAFVTHNASSTVSTIDVNTRIKRPTDINVGEGPAGMAVTPDGKTAFVANAVSGSVSTIDVRTRTKHPTDITVGLTPAGVAVTPCRR
jgi:YVTN family beta-propeller protein